MEPWQERLLREKQELDEKILKLNQFITENPQGRFLSLDSEHRTLLREQLDAMRRYSGILERRIELLVGKVGEVE